MIKSGLVSITFRQLPAEKVLSLAQKTGLKGVEWGGDVHVPHGDLDTARRVGEATREAGLEVAAYGSYYRAGVSEAEGLPFEQVLHSALALGAPVIRVWAGVLGSAEADKAARTRVVEDLQRIAEMASRAGVRVATEFHGRTLTDTNDSTARLLGEVGHDNLATYWQPLVGMSDEVCLAALRHLAPRLSHLHVFHWKDFKNRHVLAAGEARWMRFLREAVRVPGDRFAMLEFVVDDAPDNLIRDATTLRDWLGRLSEEGK